MSESNKFNAKNCASEVLAKIGNGSADADFARAVEATIARVQQTQKKGKVVVTVDVIPDADRGTLVLRVDVIAKLPKLPPPASQMHVGPKGELLTQMEFLISGGRDEVPPAKPQPIPNEQRTGSGRFPVATPPPRAPIADGGPRKAPIAGEKAGTNTGDTAGETEA